MNVDGKAFAANAVRRLTLYWVSCVPVKARAFRSAFIRQGTARQPIPHVSFTQPLGDMLSYTITPPGSMENDSYTGDRSYTRSRCPESNRSSNHSGADTCELTTSRPTST